MKNINYLTVPSSNGLDKNAEMLTRLPKGQFNTTAKKICTYRGPEFCPSAAEHQRRKGVKNPETHPEATTHPITWLTEEAIKTGKFFREDGKPVTKLAFECKFRNIIERLGFTRKAFSKKHSVYAITRAEFIDALLEMVMHHSYPSRGKPQIRIRNEDDAMFVIEQLLERWNKPPSEWGEAFIPKDPPSPPTDKLEPKYEIIAVRQPHPSLWEWLTKLLYNLVTPFITAWNGVKDLFSKATGGLTNA